MEKKLQEANNLIKKEIVERSDKNSWRYIDFVLEDRFLHEIKDDDYNIEEHTAEEIAEYAIEHIYS